MKRYTVDWAARPNVNAVGKRYEVRGHWSGDFSGVMTFRGLTLAIIKDDKGTEREVVYTAPVQFRYAEVAK